MSTRKNEHFSVSMAKQTVPTKKNCNHNERQVPDSLSDVKV